MKTSQRQTSPRGEVKSTYSQEVSLANHSVAPDSERERMITVTSGRRCYAQYGRYSPLGSLVKTLLASSRWYSPARRLRWDAQTLCSRRITYTERSSGSPSTKSARVLSVQDMPSSRLLFRLVPSERPTGGTGFGLSQGLLPTPTAIDSGTGRVNKSQSPNAKERPTIGMAARMGLLPTPCAQDGKNSTLPPSQEKRCSLIAKVMQADLLPTPMSKDWKAGQRVDGATKTRPSGETYSAQLSDLAASDLLPTPMSTDIHHGKRVKELKAAGGDTFHSRANGETRPNGLTDFLDFNGLLPTPRVNKVNGLDLNNEALANRNKGNLEEAVAKIVTSCPPTDGATSQLNPLFVCDMMGFPITWLDI